MTSMSLRDVVFGYPAIDNHAHPLLKEEHRQDLPFEGVISEAQSNAAKDAVHSLPGYRATRGSITVIEAQTDRQRARVRGGLALIDVSAWDMTVVAKLADTGLQLLIPDDGPSPSRQLIPPTLTAHPLDKGRIIVIVPTDRDRIILLQTATILQVLMIPAQEHVPVPTDRTAVLCASLQNKTAVHSFAKDGKEHLQLWEFGYRSPQWTVQVNELPSAGDISLTYDRLVTFHGGRSRSAVRVFDLSDGGLLAELEDVWSTPPLDITFDSEHRFYFHHDTYRIPYDVTATRSHTNSNSIIRGGQLRLVEQVRKKQYSVDDGHEWVVSSSQRICWIPPGYIGSTEASYCWAGSSLVMVGQNGTLRALVF